MFANHSRIAIAVVALALTACSYQAREPVRKAPVGTPSKETGGQRYEQAHDSGPPQPVNMLATPEPTPVREPIGKAGNRSPYVVNGVRYSVLDGVKGYQESGHASWYGTKFHGKRTANGEVYNMYAMSAAHKTLPLPSYARVTNLENGRTVIVRVNDRGPFVPGRLIDLSYTAAQKLGFIDQGVAEVEVVAIDPETLPSASELASRAEASDAGRALAEDASFKLPQNTFLQVGAFSDAAQAGRIRGQVAAVVDYPVAVSPVQRGGRTLYRVRIGPIVQQQDLLALRESVEDNRLGKPQVVYD